MAPTVSRRAGNRGKQMRYHGRSSGVRHARHRVLPPRLPRRWHKIARAARTRQGRERYVIAVSALAGSAV